MERRFFTAFVFLIVSAPFMFGQQNRTPPTPAQIVANRVARLTMLLTLTTTQQTQATNIFTTQQTALSGLEASMKTARATLLTAVEANDAGTISAQANQIGSLTTQEVAARATADAAFYAILTADQKTKFKQLPGGGPGGQGKFARGRR